MTIEQELSLVAQAQNGNRAALGSLWDVITPKLYGYLINTLRDSHLAEDILQNTWLKATGSISKFKPQGVRFSAWLFAIAKNECRQHWRAQKFDEPITENLADNLRDNTREDITEKLYLESVLRRLSEDEQELLRLRYISGFSFKEIAKILNISAITARVRIHRTLGRARVNLAN
ncbi:MAG: hypothetical protein A3J93_00545 [Candidatus Magasanikbacteria bacterium RIFOXYC2_FULL_42_28]|uniref:HTH luxR-type domain-containing protein n=1 Tax=Candidatus Magasanikbacteria bacterium RIFOXYC2_FULL_42_28 TaxID=1798704 RepID=A0A1F6NWB1_9BACT|nr:MAG: hypothetical protein A3J93_00545 [Candidatus Magasanikbacteria bacterium RIFOXYC2_FULL_42_28]